ncbi:MAG: hypothetical protein QOD02_770 [Mycobacterium sp.]|nr:hypothetical protein [Mycobacterium sp.]
MVGGDQYECLRADFAQRGRIAEEYIAAIRALLETADARFHGEHINFDNVGVDPRLAKAHPACSRRQQRGGHHPGSHPR